jgi:hypothetical protein
VPANRQSNRPWIGPVIGVVLVLTAVGGLVARSIYQPGASAAAAPPAATPPTTDQTTSGTPVKQPGSSQVLLSADAAQSPYGGAVHSLLQAYFNAINDQSYVEWESTVTAAFIASNPRPTWEASYLTTQDGSMYVYRIDAAPGGTLRVLLTFTSVQDLSKAPPWARFGCINWQSVLSLTDNTKSGWKIDNNSAGGHPIANECPSV